MSSLMKEAIEDLRYLLSRGYPRSSAVRFVGDRYLLDKPQRMILYRGVFPEEVARMRRAKLVEPEHVSGKRISIDGFNVLWTVSSAMRGDPVYLCDDGFVRDVSAVHGSVEGREVSEPLKVIVSTLASLNPRKSLFFFDKSISKSGEISGKVRALLSEHSIVGASMTVPSSDYSVLKSGEIIATSDSIVADKAALLFDLAGYIIRERLNVKPVALNELYMEYA